MLADREPFNLRKADRSQDAEQIMYANLPFATQPPSNATI